MPEHDTAPALTGINSSRRKPGVGLHRKARPGRPTPERVGVLGGPTAERVLPVTRVLSLGGVLNPGALHPATDRKNRARRLAAVVGLVAATGFSATAGATPGADSASPVAAHAEAASESDRADNRAETAQRAERYTRAAPSPLAAQPSAPASKAPAPAAAAKAVPPPPPAWVSPVGAYDLTSFYGPRWGAQHAGVDLAGPVGTPIRAIGGGVVTTAGWYGGYGIAIIIDHGNGLASLYGHNSSAVVSVGQRVTTGQVVAAMGSTGDSTGPHCHFEVHVGGSPVDPIPWMQNHGVSLQAGARSVESNG